MIGALLPALAGLAALLAGLVAFEITRPPPMPAGDAVAVAPPPPAPTAAAAATSDAAQLRSWVATILARPLFSHDRRPVEGAAPVLVADVLPRLTGITVSPGGRHAIFAGSAGKPVVASPGDHLGGFTVQAIEPGEVTVAGAGGTRVLRPSFSAAAPAGAASPATPPERLPPGRLPVFRGRFPEAEFNRGASPPAATEP